MMQLPLQASFICHLIALLPLANDGTMNLTSESIQFIDVSLSNIEIIRWRRKRCEYNTCKDWQYIHLSQAIL